MSRFFGSVRQNGYVVRDMHAGMRWWSEVAGVGPFFYVERLTLDHYKYRGQEMPPPALGFAIGQSGDFQIELLQQHDDTPSMYRDFLDSGCEGFHHMAYWTHHFDRDIQHLLECGMEIQQAGQSVTGGADARFAYLIDGPQGIVIEISDTSGSKGELYRRVAEAAAGWDGRDPFRKLEELLS